MLKGITSRLNDICFVLNSVLFLLFCFFSAKYLKKEISNFRLNFRSVFYNLDFL